MRLEVTAKKAERSREGAGVVGWGRGRCARHDPKAAVPPGDVRQLEGAYEHAAAHLAVPVDVVRPVSEEVLRRAVDGHPTAESPCEARLCREHHRRVVHPPPSAEQGVQVGDQLPVGEQVAEGLAQRLRPLQHAVELVDSPPLR
eukprot:COSAG04_NODE_4959_length_1805_cov_1.365182_2_plen_144_part_00